MTETSKVINNYSLVVKGVFGRNRKEKVELFKLAEIETHLVLGENELNQLVGNKLKEIKVKNGAVRVTVQEETVAVLTYSDGVVMNLRKMQCVAAKCLKSFNIVDGVAV